MQLKISRVTKDCLLRNKERKKTNYNRVRNYESFLWFEEEATSQHSNQFD